MKNNEVASQAAVGREIRRRAKRGDTKKRTGGDYVIAILLLGAVAFLLAGCVPWVIH